MDDIRAAPSPSLHVDDQGPGDAWSGWSYYGRYRGHDSTEEYRACDLKLTELARPGREGELRVAAQADWCAFVRLIGILVDGDRLEELRELARDGDDRALVTLMELLMRRGSDVELRQESAESPRARYWLSALLVRQGRVDEALEVLRDLSRLPDHAYSAHAQILSVLTRADRVGELRRLADSGDRAAGRHLNRWLADRHDIVGLRERADGGDRHALRNLNRLLAEAHDPDGRTS